MKPNKNFIKKWVKTLRSRKFKQCQSSLRNADQHYCCIGVACELFGLSKDCNTGFVVNETYINGSIPGNIWELKTGLPNIVQEELINMNDVEGKKFYRIANYLERKFL
jgi:hypothetical protein